MFTTVITVTILYHSSRNRYICSFIHPIPFHSIPIQFHSSDSKASTSNDILVVTLTKILDHFPSLWSKHAMPIILPSEMKLPDTSVLLLPAVVRNLRNPKKVVLWAFFKKLILTMSPVVRAFLLVHCKCVFMETIWVTPIFSDFGDIHWSDCENWNGVWITFFYDDAHGGRFSFVVWNVWDIVEVVLDRWLSVSEILVPPKVQG